MGRLKQSRNEIITYSSDQLSERYYCYLVDPKHSVIYPYLSIGATKLGAMKTAQKRFNRLQRELAVLIKREERRLRREKK